jgi:hypothetical protein
VVVDDCTRECLRHLDLRHAGRRELDRLHLKGRHKAIETNKLALKQHDW